MPTALKVIIQTPLLTDEQIKIAPELIIQTGCDFVKTGPGFYGPTTIEAEQLVENRAQVKAAGGINRLYMIEKLKVIGVTRFGISNAKIVALLEELNAL